MEHAYMHEGSRVTLFPPYLASHDMPRFTFKRLHIPSGDVTDGEAGARSELEALRLLADWNRKAIGLWQYWVA